MFTAITAPICQPQRVTSPGGYFTELVRN